MTIQATLITKENAQEIKETIPNFDEVASDVLRTPHYAVIDNRQENEMIYLVPEPTFEEHFRDHV